MLKKFAVFPSRAEKLVMRLKDRILVIDGAMGTQIQNLNLVAEDFGGEALEGCNEYLNVTRPHLIQDIHRKYLMAGADIVETNSFGSTPVVLDEYALGDRAYEISKLSAEIARQAADEFSTDEWPRFVAGSIGPTTKAISVTGGITFKELVANFKTQTLGLIDGGADYLLIETAQDSRNIKAALIAIHEVEEARQQKFLVAISGTIETLGTMLAGQPVEAFLASVMHRELLYIGLNCATGPEFMTDHLRSLSALAPFPVACVPNAGLPDEDGKYLETPVMMANRLQQFIDQGWINLIGGCCGTEYPHIEAFVKVARAAKPRVPQPVQGSYLSGIDFLEVEPGARPMIVGERTNVIGSKKFKDLITAQKIEEAAEVGRQQVRAGAHIIDICLSNPDRDEMTDAIDFYEKVVRLVKAPLMIDSTDEKVIELALTYCQGKSIINSVNLEDGEERFEKVVPLANKYGAALVVGTIDEDREQGMAVTKERKLAVAKRSHEILTKKYKFSERDIYFDPLVFPCASGDQNYLGSAKATIEGLRLIKQAFPNCKTVLGISNVSFGLPAAGREVLNSVFLHHCVEAGLDLAIVNSEKLERYASIGEKELQLANRLLFEDGAESRVAIQEFTEHFRSGPKKVAAVRDDWPLEKRLSHNIIEGTKEGLIKDLEAAILNSKPLEIINGPLMAGMDEVGKLFNANKLIVAEVLQSAEVMKTAVAFLEPYMEKSESVSRGKMILATVKGDVHDIGKNLVDIILTNNGYNVINLGIKIAPEQIIEAVRLHKPDFIGLSGLLVKSAQQMVSTAEDLTRAGIETPILVGGAALSRNFTEKKILTSYAGSVFYAQDAMQGLDLVNRLSEPKESAVLIQENLELKKARRASALNEAVADVRPLIPESTARSEGVEILASVPQAPDHDRHILRSTPIQVIWKYINPLMLYGRHLGLKGAQSKWIGELEVQRDDTKILKELDEKSLQIYRAVEELKDESAGLDLFAPAAVYQFFRVRSLQNRVLVFDQKNKQISEFDFPRQPAGDRLCLADYVAPVSGTQDDAMAFFVVTAGKNVRKFSESLRHRGEYLKSHIVQALAIETAEAYAEWLHGFLREQWGFPDPLNMRMIERFQAKYRGKRYSFGYPACPKLDDQKPLFDLLRPQEIGVELTDGMMMDPEASVSAVVFHHPKCQYFSVGRGLDAIREVE